jgi:hypothetical protein
MEAFQANGNLPEQSGQLTWLLTGTALVLLMLRLLSLPREAKLEAEVPTSLLSYYVVDTEFLARCAAVNPGAIKRSDLLAPEIRMAVLRLAAGRR